MRGKIFRDTNQGDGVVFVDGQQKPFSLQQWNAATPPKLGSVVEVLLADDGTVTALSPVDEATLAKEQAAKAMGQASELGKQALSQVLARVSPVTLVCIGLLALSWLWLSLVNVNISARHVESATFYELLKLLNNQRDLSAVGGLKYLSAGVYGFFMWVVLLAPLASHFHPNKYLTLGYCAPLGLLLVAALQVNSLIQKQVSEASSMAGMFGGAAGAEMAEKMMNEMATQMMRAISMGLGFYLAVAAALVLAGIGVRKFLAARAMA